MFVTVHTEGTPTDLDSGGGGRGLVGLRERAHAAGGNLHAGPHAGGYRLIATIPLTDATQRILLDHRSQPREPVTKSEINSRNKLFWVTL